MYKLLIGILLLLGVGYFAYRYNVIAKFQEYITLKHMVKLTSSAFVDNGLIPPVYTCDGMAVNPPLDIADVPGIAQSMVLIVEDPDAPGATYTHWLLYNIPPNTLNIPEKGVPVGAMQGLSTSGNAAYDAPCPPSGSHRYVFTLYVLDKTLPLPSEAAKADIQDAMKDHIVDKAQLIGRYMKQN